MRSNLIAFLASVSLVSACGDPEMMVMPDPPTLQTDAPVSFAVVYEAEMYSPFGGAPREWIPVDVTPSTNGELWVIQRMPRHPDFDEFTECTSRSQAGAPNDCAGLQGSTVALRDPTNAEPATGPRANLVVDANAWHFMRRPSAIAFGAAETVLSPDDPRALDPMTGLPLIDEPLVYTDLFATCPEHWTGNFTDQPAFIGPSLWTADREIYNGDNGTFEWSNGSHLDMLHGTENCMGIAWESGNIYWTLNGELGVLDRYDFGMPHYQGGSDHEDGAVTRYELDSPLVRLPDVPSNMVMQGTDLWIADAGNGRVVRLDTAQPMTEVASFQTPDPITGPVMEAALTTVVDQAALAMLWGPRVEPSGLAFFDDETVVVANHGSGHVSLFAPDGTHLRTIDTGLGEGIGGLTVMDGVVYFAHMVERNIYRIDVDTSLPEMPME